MKFLQLVRKGLFGAPEGSEKWETVETPPHSRLLCTAQGKFRAVPLFSAVSVFNNLPNATSAAAGKDELLVSIGTGTEVIARAAKGGVNVKTQVTTPADNDNAMLVGLANNGTNVPITSVSKPRFSTRISLSQITGLQASFGFDENLTAVDPTGTAGDGAKFCFDPGKEITTGLAAGAENNWILSQKKAGVDTFIDSGVPVAAGQVYELEIVYAEDLKPSYYIDGVLVGTGVANTASATVGVVLGVQVNDASTPAQKDFDCRYVAVERFIG